MEFIGSPTGTSFRFTACPAQLHYAISTYLDRAGPARHGQWVLPVHILTGWSISRLRTVLIAALDHAALFTGIAILVITFRACWTGGLSTPAPAATLYSLRLTATHPTPCNRGSTARPRPALHTHGWAICQCQHHLFRENATCPGGFFLNNTS